MNSMAPKAIVMSGMPPGMQRTAWSKKIALSAVGLVRKAVLEDLLILRSEWGFLSSAPGLSLVVRRLAAGREATIRFKRGSRGKPARPRAFPVRVPRVACGLNRTHHDPAGH